MKDQRQCRFHVLLEVTHEGDLGKEVETEIHAVAIFKKYLKIFLKEGCSF